MKRASAQRSDTCALGGARNILLLCNFDVRERETFKDGSRANDFVLKLIIFGCAIDGVSSARIVVVICIVGVHGKMVLHLVYLMNGMKLELHYYAYDLIPTNFASI